MKHAPIDRTLLFLLALEVYQPRELVRIIVYVCLGINWTAFLFYHWVNQDKEK